MPTGAQLPPPAAPKHQWRSAAASSHCCSTCTKLWSTATLCRRPAAATVAAPALCFLFHGHAAPQPSLRTSPYFKSTRLHMVIAAARLHHNCSSYSNIGRCPRHLSTPSRITPPPQPGTRRHHLHPKPSITSPASRVNSPRRVVKVPSRAPALGNRQLVHSPTRQPATLRLGHSAAAHAPKLHARLLALSTRSTLRSRRPYATPLAAQQHGRASASQHRHTAAPQQHDQYSISTSTTSTASAPAATAARPAHHQHQQLHSRRPRHPSPARRRTSSPHITSASAHRHSQAPFRSKLVPMPQYADSPNPSRLFNSAASAMNAAGASFAPHRRSPVLRRTRPRAHDRVVSRLLPRCIASHRIAMMRLQMKTLVGALSSCKSVAFE